MTITQTIRVVTEEDVRRLERAISEGWTVATKVEPTHAGGTYYVLTKPPSEATVEERMSIQDG